jgi:hypothetical protein
MAAKPALEVEGRVQCLSCHHYIPSDALACEYCGAMQAEALSARRKAGTHASRAKHDERDEWRAAMEAFEEEAAAIPFGQRRRMQAAAWLLSDHDVGLVLSGLGALLLGLALGQAGRQLLAAQCASLAWCRGAFWAGLALGSFFSYGAWAKGVGWLRGYLLGQLTGKKAFLIDQARRLKRLEEHQARHSPAKHHKKPIPKRISPHQEP